MHDFLSSLAHEEFRELNVLLDAIAIPNDIAKECITSGLSLLLYESDYAEEEGMHGLAEARADFDRLCNAAPNVSRECIKWLSIAFGLVIYFLKDQSDSDKIEGGVLALMNISMAKGAAVGHLPRSVEYSFAEAMARRSKMLSLAGSRGAEMKNRPHAELKKWALKEAKGMKEQDTEIARKLAQRLPVYLADISKNPARLIYDALRAAK